MDEHEFWQGLEFRICAEFAGLTDQRLRYYWCDGLIPEGYDLASAEPASAAPPTAGNAANQPGAVAVHRGPRPAGAPQINWPALLPRDR